MRILKTHSVDHEGNDCWIYESFTIVSSFETLFFVHHVKVTGWAGENYMTTTEIDDNEHLKRMLEHGDYDLSEETINYLCNFE